MAGNLYRLLATGRAPVKNGVSRLFQPTSASFHDKARIGNRDVVGYGVNGTETYIDRLDFPMPAIRWKENTPEVKSLREKEKGDWKKLSLDEKKALYRASFCQTFSEMKAPTGEWKAITAGCLLGGSLVFLIYVFMKKYVYPPLPITITDPKYKEAQLQRVIDLSINPIEGVASKYDYENKRWKD